jgi:hypothetical protein
LNQATSHFDSPEVEEINAVPLREIDEGLWADLWRNALEVVELRLRAAVRSLTGAGLHGSAATLDMLEARFGLSRADSVRALTWGLLLEFARLPRSNASAAGLWDLLLNYRGDAEVRSAALASVRGRTGYCGRNWHSGDFAYRCEDCGFDDPCAICVECFRKGNHEGHDYKIIVVGGGCCDCGDPISWRPSGNCRDHSGIRTGFDSSSLLPADWRTHFEAVLQPVLMFVGYCLLKIGHDASSSSVTEYVSERTVAILRFCVDGVDRLAGDPFRRLLGNILWTLPPLSMACAPDHPVLRSFSKDMKYCNLLVMFVRLDGYLGRQLQSELRRFYFSLVGDPWFKNNFGRIFVHHYSWFFEEICRTLDIGNGYVDGSLMTISTQFLHPTMLADYVNNENVLESLWTALHSSVSRCISECGQVDFSSPMASARKYWYFLHDLRSVMTVRDCCWVFFERFASTGPASFSLYALLECANPQVRELTAHVPYSNDGWQLTFSLELDLFQRLMLHMELAVLDISSPSTFTADRVADMLRHFGEAQCARQLRVESLAQSGHGALRSWSFHPLSMRATIGVLMGYCYRYFSGDLFAAVSSVVNRDGGAASSWARQCLVIPAARTVCLSDQILARLWARNGECMNDQASYYRFHRQSVLHVADLAALQHGAVLMDRDAPASFVRELLGVYGLSLQSFRLQLGRNAGLPSAEFSSDADLLQSEDAEVTTGASAPAGVSVDDEHVAKYCETFLVTLLQLVSERTVVSIAAAWSSADPLSPFRHFVRSSILQQLCVGDSIRSALSVALPDVMRLGVATDLTEVYIQELSLFIDATQNRQGVYRLRPNFWSEFDPFYTFFSPVEEESALERYRAYVASLKDVDRPPQLLSVVPLPRLLPLPPSLVGLYESILLNDDVLGAIRFTLLAANGAQSTAQADSGSASAHSHTSRAVTAALSLLWLAMAADVRYVLRFRDLLIGPLEGIMDLQLRSFADTCLKHLEHAHARIVVAATADDALSSNPAASPDPEDGSDFEAARRREFAKMRQARMLQMFSNAQKNFAQISNDVPDETRAESEQLCLFCHSPGSVEAPLCLLVYLTRSSTLPVSQKCSRRKYREYDAAAGAAETSSAGCRTGHDAADGLEYWAAEDETHSTDHTRSLRGRPADDVEDNDPSDLSDLFSRVALQPQDALPPGEDWRSELGRNVAESARGVYVRSCGHAAHNSCVVGFLESAPMSGVRTASRALRGEFSCPLCRRMCNGRIPALSLSCFGTASIAQALLRWAKEMDVFVAGQLSGHSSDWVRELTSAAGRFILPHGVPESASGPSSPSVPRRAEGHRDILQQILAVSSEVVAAGRGLLAFQTAPLAIGAAMLYPSVASMLSAVVQATELAHRSNFLIPDLTAQRNPYDANLSFLFGAEFASAMRSSVDSLAPLFSSWMMAMLFWYEFTLRSSDASYSRVTLRSAVSSEISTPEVELWSYLIPSLLRSSRLRTATSAPFFPLSEFDDVTLNVGSGLHAPGSRVLSPDAALPSLSEASKSPADDSLRGPGVFAAIRKWLRGATASRQAQRTASTPVMASSPYPVSFQAPLEAGVDDSGVGATASGRAGAASSNSVSVVASSTSIASSAAELSHVALAAAAPSGTNAVVPNAIVSAAAGGAAAVSPPVSPSLSRTAASTRFAAPPLTATSDMGLAAMVSSTDNLSEDVAVPNASRPQPMAGIAARFRSRGTVAFGRSNTASGGSSSASSGRAREPSILAAAIEHMTSSYRNHSTSAASTSATVSTDSHALSALPLGSSVGGSGASVAFSAAPSTATAAGSAPIDSLAALSSERAVPFHGSASSGSLAASTGPGESRPAANASTQPDFRLASNRVVDNARRLLAMAGRSTQPSASSRNASALATGRPSPPAATAAAATSAAAISLTAISSVVMSSATASPVMAAPSIQASVTASRPASFSLDASSSTVRGGGGGSDSVDFFDLTSSRSGNGSADIENDTIEEVSQSALDMSIGEAASLGHSSEMPHRKHRRRSSEFPASTSSLSETHVARKPHSLLATDLVSIYVQALLLSFIGSLQGDDVTSVTRAGPVLVAVYAAQVLQAALSVSLSNDSRVVSRFSSLDELHAERMQNGLELLLRLLADSGAPPYVFAALDRCRHNKLWRCYAYAAVRARVVVFLRCSWLVTMCARRAVIDVADGHAHQSSSEIGDVGDEISFYCRTLGLMEPVEFLLENLRTESASKLYLVWLQELWVLLASRPRAGAGSASLLVPPYFQRASVTKLAASVDADVAALFMPSLPFPFEFAPDVVPYKYHDLPSLCSTRQPRCDNCKHAPRHPVICLFCGQLMCFGTRCCFNETTNLDEMRDHADPVEGICMALLVRRSIFVLQRLHTGDSVYWPSLWLDDFGESDVDLRRGKPLYLNHERHHRLRHLLLSYGLEDEIVNVRA